MTKETANNSGLLKTKYIVPRHNKQLIPRRAASQLLDDSTSHKLTLVTAPAGYGKTTAVLKWLETISLPYAWLSIDTGDNDSLVFWRYFCAALDNISAGISKDTEYVFASQELFRANIHLNILIDRLSDIPSHFLLVLDDLHLIANPAIYEMLSYFLTYMPPNMHLILIGRIEPHMKLNRLDLKEDLVRIGAKELHFEKEEISSYFKVKGYSLKEEEIQRIESYTEGWAAALVAVTMSLKDEKFRHNIIQGFGSCNPHIENYLAEDVFNTWTEEQQDFMVETAILDRLFGPLCKAITDFDGDRLLEELYLQNSFLVALDDEQQWFRYHHLFSDFLKKKLKRKGTAFIQRLHAGAAEWLKENSYFSEAIEHFLEASHYEEALLLIETHGAALARRREYSNLLSWIDRLPDKYRENSPMLALLKASYFIETGDFSNAHKYIEALEPAMKEGANWPETVQTTFLMVKANIFLRQGDLEKSLKAILGAAVRGIGTAMSKDYLDINPYDISLYRSIYHVFFKMLRKSPREYSSLVNNYRSLISKKPGYAPLIEAEFYYECGRLDDALPKLLEAADEAVNARCAGALVPTIVTMAYIRRAKGDIQGALELIEECENRLSELQKPHWGYMLRALKTYLYIGTNDVEKLDKWVMESRLNLYQDIVRVREYELIVLARVLIHKKRYSDANFLLNRLLTFVEGLKTPHSIVEITNLLAITAIKNLDEETALNYLQKSLSIGIEEGYLRIFVDELSPMVPLLEMYINKHKSGGRLTTYAKKLLKLTKEAICHAMLPADTNAIESLLTSVEKKVLKQIISGSTNKEIADVLEITLRTVKAHAGSIYKKLAVKNRAQCIKKVML